MSGLRADARRTGGGAPADPAAGASTGAATERLPDDAADRHSTGGDPDQNEMLTDEVGDGDIANLSELFGAGTTAGANGGPEAEHPRAVRRRRAPKPLASWALTASMFGLSMSWFMPWALPASFLAVVLGGIALARRWEDRAMAGWGLGLGLAGAASAGFWILWILDQLSASPL